MHASRCHNPQGSTQSPTSSLRKALTSSSSEKTGPSGKNYLSCLLPSSPPGVLPASDVVMVEHSGPPIPPPLETPACTASPFSPDPFLPHSSPSGCKETASYPIVKANRHTDPFSMEGPHVTAQLAESKAHTQRLDTLPNKLRSSGLKHAESSCLPSVITGRAVNLSLCLSFLSKKELTLVLLSKLLLI